MAKMKAYRVVVTSVMHVDTSVLARSEAEALRVARSIPERDWNENGTAHDFEGFEVSDVTEPSDEERATLPRPKRNDR